MEKTFLFVVPRFAKKNDYYVFPYGLGYVIANLKKHGFRVLTLNLCHHDESIAELLTEKITGNLVDIVCTGGISFYWAEVEDVVTHAKKINPQIITVVGGAIVTSDVGLALENMPIDIGVIGEGEETMVDLADALCIGRDLKTVPGIGYRDAWNKIRVNDPRLPIQDLDSLPFPDYESLEFGKWLEIDWVEQPSFQGLLFDLNNRQRLVEINTSRSCPFRCTFCFHPLGNKYRQRSLDNVFKEIDFLIEKYNITLINLLDELFSADETRISEFSERIKKYDVRWMAQWRVDNVNEEIIRKVKESNVLNLGLGVESMSDTVLASMKKRITRAKIERAYKICDNQGVRLGSNLIFGDIAETEATIRESMDFWMRHPEYNISLGFIKAVPNSEIWQYAVTKGLIKDKKQFILDKFPIINLTSMNDRIFETFKREIYEINFLNKYLAKGSVISSRKTDDVYRNHPVFIFSVKCPICSEISEYTYIQYSHHPDSIIYCKHCYKRLKIPTRSAYAVPLPAHVRSLLHTYLVVLFCIKLRDSPFLRPLIRMGRRILQKKKRD